MQEKGQGVTKDIKKAAQYYLIAARSGNKFAQYKAGILYREGLGVDPNDTTSFEWHMRAAKQGLEAAQYAVGEMLLKGIGTTTDPVAGYVWIALAARNGDPEFCVMRDFVASNLPPRQLAHAQKITSTIMKDLPQ